MDKHDLRNLRADLPEAEPWVKRLGQVGLSAKGIVYLIVGVLAVMAAIGAGGQTTDTGGALEVIYAQPFGQILLALVGIGMIAYAIFRFVGAYKDIDAQGSDGSGKAKRAVFALSGLPYLALGLTAIGIVIGYNLTGGGGEAGGGQNGQEQTASMLMDQPLGRWLVGILGAIVIAAGLYQIYKGIQDKFLEKVKTATLTDKQFDTIRLTGKAGHIARGVVMAIIGGFFIQAAITYNPDQAGGLTEAFNTLAAQPFGWILLGLVALGFALFGVYSLMLARFRHYSQPASALPHKHEPEARQYRASA